MLKILHIQLFSLLSGVQKVSLDEFSALTATFNYVLLCKEPGPLTIASEKLGVKSIYVETLQRQISLFDDIFSAFRIYSIARNGHYDVVHTHSSKTGVIGRIAAKFAGVPRVVHTVHGFSFPAAKSRLEYTLFFGMEWVAKYFTDILIVLNRTDYEIAIDKLGFSASKVRVVANGVDTTVYKPIDSLQRKIHRANRLPNATEGLCGMMVGRLSEQKNPVFLLNALISLNDREKLPHDFRFYFIGDGPLRGVMEELIERSKIGIKVNLIGWADNIQELLPLADFCVLPSSWEGMPLAILEALSCGVPCLVSDISGNRECVKHDQNGMIFSTSSEDELQSCILKLIDAPELLIMMSRQARESSMKFDLQKRTKAIIDIYHDH